MLKKSNWKHFPRSWRHSSLFLFRAKAFSSFSDCWLYADLPSFLPPSFSTGDSLRQDLVFISKSSILSILELTVGFESNIQINCECKASKYSSLITDLKQTYSNVKFVNLSMSTIGIMGKSSESLLLMLDDLNLDKPTQNYVIRKVMNIAIRCTYYIFCHRNKQWSNPDLLDFWFIYYLPLSSFFTTILHFFLLVDIFLLFMWYSRCTTSFCS